MNEKISNKTILIAMTGGVESTVAAYLLKKQGYTCIGIGLQLFEAGDEKGPFADVEVSDLNRVNAICTYLDIPFYGVNISELFIDTVLDPTVGRILSGHTFEPLVFLNLVLMEVLIEKAKKFHTTLVATAHYAKVLKNQKTGSFELLVANDVEHDQSYMLSRLAQRHLENLILPLAEIRKQEVEKIGQLIKVDYVERPKSNIHHIMRDPRMIDLIEARSPKDLRRTGNVYDYREENSICEHIGIHHFYIGRKDIPFRPESPIDPNKEVVMIVPFKGNVFIDYPDRLKYSHALLCRFIPADNLDVTLPLSLYVKMSSGGKKIPCRLYVKNNQTCLVDFESEREGLLVPGQFFVFYTKELGKGKVIGSGMVEFGGVFMNNKYNTLPVNKKKSDEEEEETDNKDDDKLYF